MFVLYRQDATCLGRFQSQGRGLSDDFSQALSRQVWPAGFGRVRQVGGKGSWSHEGRCDVSISTTHLTHQKPRRPGATRRAGNP